MPGIQTIVDSCKGSEEIIQEIHAGFNSRYIQTMKYVTTYELCRHGRMQTGISTHQFANAVYGMFIMCHVCVNYVVIPKQVVVAVELPWGK